MKKLFTVLFTLILTLTAISALAEDTTPQGIAGSDAAALADALKEFGLGASQETTSDGRLSWSSRYETINGATCNYSMLATGAGEVISATFTVQNADNGLFAVVAAMGYDAAMPDVAASFIKSNLKKEAAMTIGDARFSLKPGSVTSTSSITIGTRTKSSTTTTKTYTLRIEYTSEASGEVSYATLNHDAKLREEPNGNSKYTGTAKKGEMLMVSAPFYNEQWHQIIYNGDVRYVYADYCEFVSE